MVTVTRKERERRRHRREVLEAAEGLFSKRGFHETTVQDIAKEAEFAVGTLYNMFDNKSEIYYEIVRIRAFEYLKTVKKDLAPVSDPVEKLKKIIRAKIDFFNQHRQFFSIFSRVLHEQPDECPLNLSEQGRRIYDEYINLIQDIFKQGLEKKLFADTSPEMLTLAFEGITRTVISDYFLCEESPDSKVIEEVELVLFNGILR